MKATWNARDKKDNINSLVRLLSLNQPAKLPEISEADKDPVLQLIRAEINEMRREFRESPSREWRLRSESDETSNDLFLEETSTLLLFVNDIKNRGLAEGLKRVFGVERTLSERIACDVDNAEDFIRMVAIYKELSISKQKILYAAAREFKNEFNFEKFRRASLANGVLVGQI